MDEYGHDQVTRKGSVDSMSSFVSVDSQQDVKWKNTSHCGLCGAKIGKRHFNPRHHCRVCGLCVCSTCSSSTVQLEGQPGLHRACKNCAATSVKEEQGALCIRDRRCSSNSTVCSTSAGSSISQPVEESFGMCNQVIRDATDECRKLKVSEDELAKQTETARLNFLKLGQRIHNLSGAASTYSWTSELRNVTLEEAAALCDVAMEIYEKQVHRRDALTAISPRAHLTSPREAFLRPVLGRDLLAVDPENGEFPTAPQSGRRKVRCKWGFCSFLLCIAVAAVVVVGCLAAFRTLKLPSLVQNGVNAATVSISQIQLSDVHGSHCRLRASVTLTAPFAGIVATISQFSAHLVVNGRNAAAFEVPQIQFPSGKAATFDIDSQLYHVGQTSLLGGDLVSDSNQWEIHGQTSLAIFGQKVNIDISKTLMLPQVPFLDTRAQNIDILSGSASELHGFVDLEFFSSGIVDITSLGPVVFTLHPSALPSAKLGEISTQEFSVNAGANTLRSAKVVLRKSKVGSISESALSNSFGTWASGVAQTLLLHGPLIRRNSSLVNAFGLAQKFNLTIPGLASRAMMPALVNNFYSIRGHMPDSGKACAPGEGADCFRGSLNLVESSIIPDVRIKDMSYDVDLLEPLGYNTLLHWLSRKLPAKTVTCAKRQQVARLFSAKGMWTVLNASRAQDDFITLHGVARNHTKKELTSFFLPGKPQPGQDDGSACLGEKDYDCCFSTLLTAAACYYKKRGKTYIPASLKGNQTVVVGDFSLNIQIVQRSFPVSFEEDVASFANGFVSMTCDDFEFY